jgi:tRNA A-37 threonylcarbamoyl transferase component Bud32
MQASNSPALTSLFDTVQGRLVSTGTSGHIHKVEVSGNLELNFEMELGDTSNWYHWDGQEPCEIDISRDRKVPLAIMLKDQDRRDALSILSYRPGRRLTLLDRSGNKPLILKGFRAGRLDGMIHRYETAHEAFAGYGVNAPTVIDYDQEMQCLVMAYEEGHRLLLSSDTADIFHLVGEALANFQDYPCPELDLFGPEQEIAVIDKRADRLQQVAGSLPADWAGLRKRIGQALESLPPAKFGLAHRDLHDKQFIQHPHFLTLLDFDLLGRADTTLDSANFLAHLVLRNLQGQQGATQKSIDICGRKFLRGLGRNEEPGFWDRLRFYQATTFCRLALVYALRPRWHGLVPDLVRMSGRCLDDLTRIRSA